MVLELAALALGSFVVALSGALMPGPVLAVTLAGSRRRGFWFGPLVVLGHAAVELPLVVLLYWGLGEALKSDRIVITIGCVGALAMAWMAVGMLRQTRHVDDPDARQGGVMRLGAVPSGAVTSLLNPYWYLWWVTIGAVMVASARRYGWPGLAAFFAGHISGDLIWYSVISFGVSRGRRYLQGRLYKGLLIGCAVILLAMAGWFAKLAAEKILGGEAEQATPEPGAEALGHLPHLGTYHAREQAPDLPVGVREVRAGVYGYRLDTPPQADYPSVTSSAWMMSSRDLWRTNARHCRS